MKETAIQEYIRKNMTDQMIREEAFEDAMFQMASKCGLKSEAMDHELKRDMLRRVIAIRQAEQWERAK